MSRTASYTHACTDGCLVSAQNTVFREYFSLFAPNRLERKSVFRDHFSLFGQDRREHQSVLGINI